MAIGKVGRNGTLNENGAFYSVQDVNTLLENSGGGDLPTPTVEDAGKAVVVDEEGKYSLGTAGGGSGSDIVIVNINESGNDLIADKTFSEILTAYEAGKIIFYSLFGVHALANQILESGSTISGIGACITYVSGGEGGSSTFLYASSIIINNDNTINMLEYTST